MNTKLLAAGLLFVAIGCDDPTKNKTKAVTGEAVASATQATTSAGSTDYAFDQAGSKIAWTGSKVTGKHDGSFGGFKGTVHVVDGSAEKSSVNVDIDVSTITTDNEKLVTHLKSPDFFDASKFAKATFTSTEVKKGGANGASDTITGNLAMHGITKSVTFPANVKIDGNQVAVDAEFAINRKDFAINYPGKQDDLIRDDVLVKLTIRAKKPS